MIFGARRLFASARCWGTLLAEGCLQRCENLRIEKWRAGGAAREVAALDCLPLVDEPVAGNS
jgi:hypothetical protein